MNKKQASELIQTTFPEAFDKTRFRTLAINVLNRLDESKAQQWSTQYVKDAFKGHVHRYERLGTYTSPEKETVDVLVVYLTAESKLERARTAIRNFVADHLKTRDEKDAALVAFVSPTETQWRFSYVKMEYATVEKESGKIGVETRLTPARRFSYMVGEGESCHTAQTRFLDLLQDTATDPTLSQIEEAFSVEAVTKEFFGKYAELFGDINAALERMVAKDKTLRDEFTAKGVNTVDFAKKLMGQIVFLYFLQKKGWLGVEKSKDWGTGPRDFLRRMANGAYSKYENFFNDILEPLFYDTLATDRGHEAWCSRFKCRIPFLNGGLFEPIADYDWKNTDILIPNKLFTNNEFVEEGITGTGVLDVFDRYNFTVNEAEPLEKEVAIDPEMLGKVFENLIEENRRKGLGSYYTPREIVHYMCQESLINYLDTAVKGMRADIETFVRLGEQISHYESVDTKYAVKMPKSIEKNAKALDAALNTITVCDPAVGSGAFPVGMMTEIVRARAALTPYFNDVAERTPYHFKRDAIQNCLYGVDIDSSAVEIAKLRLWLSLVVDEEDVKQVKPLPNLDYKIVVGNSLLGIEKNLFNNEQFKRLEALKPQFFNETDRKQKAQLKQQIDHLIHELTNGRETFDFEIYFSEVFHAKKGFDVTLANPPYGAAFDKQFRQWARATFETAVGELDSYMLFVERSANLLKEGGALSFIIPDTWTTLINAAKFRKWLLSGFYISQLAMLNGLVFDSAVVDTMLLFLLRNRPCPHSQTKVLAADKSLHVSDVASLPVVARTCQLLWFESPDSQVKPFAAPQLESLLSKLKADAVRLDELVDYRAGCKPYEEGKGSPPQTKKVLDAKPYTGPVKRGRDWLPLLRGNDVQRYYILGKKPEWILYGEWLAAPRTMEVFSGERILIQAIRNPSLKLRILACFTKETFITRINVYSLLKKRGVDVDLYALLAVLNSRLMNWLLMKDYGLHTYVITGVRALPIKTRVCSGKSAKALRTLSERLLTAKKRSPKGDATDLEQEIDRLVYDLYDLTPEEIRIVEGKA